MITVGFTQCASTQKLEKKSPVQKAEVSFQKWMGGMPGSAGVNVYVNKENLPENTQLDSLYFRGRIAQLATSDQGYVATFNDIVKPDIIMSSDIKEEAGNQTPALEPKIPFELKADECVVSYTEEGKVKYVKFSQIKELPLLSYPSAKPRN